MSKLSMERHRTQMPCDFVDKLNAKGRNIFLGKYRTQTSTKQPLQPTCNIVRLQSLHNDPDPTTPITKNAGDVELYLRSLFGQKCNSTPLNWGE